jgi:dihydrofolate reductase
MAWVTTLFASLDDRVHAESDWQYPWFDEEYFSELSKAWKEADAFLIGATSFAGYEELVAAFPDSPMVHNLRTVPTYVVSSTRSYSEVYPDVRWLSDASAQTLDEVQARHPTIVVLGSVSLVVQLLETGVLPQLNLAVLPTVVGVGPRLWDTATAPLTFSSVSSRTLTNGITMLDLVV